MAARLTSAARAPRLRMSVIVADTTLTLGTPDPVAPLSPSSPSTSYPQYFGI